MEALKKHKINYLSPSSIATFIENPSIYILEKIFKYRFFGGAAAIRGKFIESGVNQILSDPVILEYATVDMIAKRMCNDFINECKQLKITSEEYNKELAFIEKAIQILPKELNKFGKVVSYQKEVGYEYKGVHIKGYTDFEFQNKNNLVFVDLKTTIRQPKATTRHKIQQYIYGKATNVESKLFYIQIFKTKDKLPKIEEYNFTQEDEFHIPKLIHQAIENLNYLCSLANTKDDFKRLITPNPDDWKWSDDKVKARKEVWGF